MRKFFIGVALLGILGAACGTAAAQDETVAPVAPIEAAPIEAAPIETSTDISASEAADFLEQTEPATVAEFCSLIDQLPQDAALAAFSKGYDPEWTPGMPSGTDLFFELAGRC
jgi:hypothetical protein